MISVRLDEALERELVRFAREHRMTKSDTVKKALIHYFKTVKSGDEPTAYLLGEELFGKYGSGEGDLSTTYKTRLKKRIDAKNRHR